MFGRRAVTLGLALFAFLIPTGSAFADNCFNASRPAPPGNQVTTDGNWTYFPEFGVWTFSPPANYQNGNPNHWLLAKTPYCAAGGFVAPGATPRTYTHGIQSGCGAFG